MSTTAQVLPVAPIRSGTPHSDCRASKEELLNDKKSLLGIAEDCPICERRGVACEVGCHPSSPHLLVPGNELHLYTCYDSILFRLNSFVRNINRISRQAYRVN